MHDNNVDSQEMSRCQINQTLNEPDHVHTVKYLKLTVYLVSRDIGIVL